MARQLITAIDSNVLLDVLVANSPYARASAQALAEARRKGSSVISEPVLAEIAGRLPGHEEVIEFLAEAGIRYASSNIATLHAAGKAWREYTRRRPTGVTCPNCGATQNVSCNRCKANISTRQHILADFIIGAHALTQADQLLTRDRGYYATYFPELTLA